MSEREPTISTFYHSFQCATIWILNTKAKNLFSFIIYEKWKTNDDNDIKLNQFINKDNLVYCLAFQKNALSILCIPLNAARIIPRNSLFLSIRFDSMESSFRWNLVSTINSANMRIFLCIYLLMNQYAFSMENLKSRRRETCKIWKSFSS